MGGTKSRTGLSLAELLAVVAIIAIVAGILLPTLFMARRRGFLAQDASNMRQFGLAESLYCQSHDGEHPFDLRPMVESDYIPVTLCASAADPTAIGLGNVQVENLGLVMGREWVEAHKTSFCQSYFSLFGAGQHLRVPFSDPQAGSLGWIVNLVESDAIQLDRPYLHMETGWFERLTFDGGLVRRRVETTGFGDRWHRSHFPELLFWDGTEEWVRNRN